MKFTTQQVEIKRTIDESYPIIIGEDLFNEIADRCDPDRRYAIITDSNVGPLYANKLQEAIRLNGHTCDIFPFPAGEWSKHINTVARIAGEMSKKGYGKDSTILALGGGVVGDTAGLTASLFTRGVPCEQIPTTVLAQADSSVGGKTAVDNDYGKNLLGRIEQPSRVWIDTTTLQTLPYRELRSGLAETIKHGIIQDSHYFDLQEEELVKKVLDKDPEALLYIAQENCRIKASVVKEDPTEKGLRRILNYGHTVGHAVEHLLDYSLSHGEAVSIGMMVAGRIAYALNTGFSEQDLERQKNLLVEVGLPINIPDDISNEDIIKMTSRDKKAKVGMARYCLPSGLGSMCEFDGEYAVHVDNEIVEKALDESR